MSLSPAAIEPLRALCARHGLDLRDAHLRDDVLVLVPDDLDALPDAAAIGALTEALSQRPSVRYVTLQLSAPQEPG